jgi:hypothetical protein
VFYDLLYESCPTIIKNEYPPMSGDIRKNQSRNNFSDPKIQGADPRVVV